MNATLTLDNVGLSRTERIALVGLLIVLTPALLAFLAVLALPLALSLLITGIVCAYRALRTHSPSLIAAAYARIDPLSRKAAATVSLSDRDEEPLMTDDEIIDFSLMYLALSRVSFVRPTPSESASLYVETQSFVFSIEEGETFAPPTADALPIDSSEPMTAEITADMIDALLTAKAPVVIVDDWTGAESETADDDVKSSDERPEMTADELASFLGIGDRERDLIYANVEKQIEEGRREGVCVTCACPPVQSAPTAPALTEAPSEPTVSTGLASLTNALTLVKASIRDALAETPAAETLYVKRKDGKGMRKASAAQTNSALPLFKRVGKGEYVPIG